MFGKGEKNNLGFLNINIFLIKIILSEISYLYLKIIWAKLSNCGQL